MPIAKNDLTPFGRQLRRFLRRNKMTVSQLAKEMGMSHCWISQAMYKPPQMEERKRRISEFINTHYDSDFKGK